ncbi:MAG: hypothetical protein AB8G99_00115 [Planctomycetaceae bacterium]
MESFHTALRWSHIIGGSVGLIVYWIAALTKKGGDIHKRAGRCFVYIVYYVAGTAMFSTLWGNLFPNSFVHSEGLSQERIDGIRFFTSILMLLASLTLSAAYLGVQSLRTRKTPERLGSPLLYGFFVLQIATALWLAWIGYVDMSRYGGQRFWICFGLSALGLVDAMQQVIHIRKKASQHMAWFLKHLECMAGCGAAFHTAAAVTVTRVIDLQLPGSWQLLPWVLPSAVAIIFGAALKKKYQKRFRLGETNPEQAHQTSVT